MGIIYLIKNKVQGLDDKIYVGSTNLPLPIRWNKHKFDCKKKNTTLYQNMRNHGVDNFYIEKYEEHDCDKKDLRKREGELIKSFGDKVLNQRIECRTTKEWYLDNHHKILERTKNYREQNKEKINKQKKLQFVCECGEKYTASHRARHYKTKRHNERIREKKDLCGFFVESPLDDQRSKIKK
jgi:hypothetical protein